MYWCSSRHDAGGAVSCSVRARDHVRPVEPGDDERALRSGGGLVLFDGARPRRRASSRWTPPAWSWPVASVRACQSHRHRAAEARSNPTSASAGSPTSRSLQQPGVGNSPWQLRIRGTSRPWRVGLNISTQPSRPFSLLTPRTNSVAGDPGPDRHRNRSGRRLSMPKIPLNDLAGAGRPYRTTRACSGGK